jgi:hypothetical protein
VFALLRDAGVVDDPGHDGLLAGHGRQHLPHDGGQHGLVAPRRRAHQVLERLPRRLDTVRVEPGGNGFNRLALPRQQQAAAVVLQGLLSVPVPRSARPEPSRQAAKRLSRGLGRGEAVRTKQV